MKKLLAAIVAGMFALAVTSPVIAQDKKKDEKKAMTKEAKKDGSGEGKKAAKKDGSGEGKKAAKKGDGKKKADAKQ